MEEKFEYFMERTAEDLKEIREDVKRLISFRLMLLGAAACLSVLFSVLTSLVVIYLGQSH